MFCLPFLASPPRLFLFEVAGPLDGTSGITLEEPKMLSEAHIVPFAKDLQTKALVFDKHLSLKEAIDKVKSLIAEGQFTDEKSRERSPTTLE